MQIPKFVTGHNVLVNHCSASLHRGGSAHNALVSLYHSQINYCHMRGHLNLLVAFDTTSFFVVRVLEASRLPLTPHLPLPVRMGAQIPPGS